MKEAYKSSGLKISNEKLELMQNNWLLCNKMNKMYTIHEIKALEPNFVKMAKIGEIIGI